jgi:hypothetical protein
MNNKKENNDFDDVSETNSQEDHEYDFVVSLETHESQGAWFTLQLPST